MMNNYQTKGRCFLKPTRTVTVFSSWTTSIIFSSSKMKKTIKNTCLVLLFFLASYGQGQTALVPGDIAIIKAQASILAGKTALTNPNNYLPRAVHGVVSRRCRGFLYNKFSKDVSWDVGAIQYVEIVAF